MAHEIRELRLTRKRRCCAAGCDKLIPRGRFAFSFWHATYAAWVWGVYCSRQHAEVAR